jgi:hypothetical protein
LAVDLARPSGVVYPWADPVLVAINRHFNRKSVENYVAVLRFRKFTNRFCDFYRKVTWLEILKMRSLRRLRWNGRRWVRRWRTQVESPHTLADEAGAGAVQPGPSPPFFPSRFSEPCFRAVFPGRVSEPCRRWCARLGSQARRLGQSKLPLPRRRNGVPQGEARVILSNNLMRSACKFSTL